MQDVKTATRTVKKTMKKHHDSLKLKQIKELQNPETRHVHCAMHPFAHLFCAEKRAFLFLLCPQKANGLQKQ
jgi:hypothetical protein